MSHVDKTFKRATGHGSLHGNDWLNIGIAVAAAATGAGMAGMGPMAGMMGGAGAGAAGAGAGAGTAGTVAGDAFLPGLLGGGEAAGTVAGDAFLPGMLGGGGGTAGSWMTGAGETLGGGLGAPFGMPEAGSWMTGSGDMLGGGLGGGGGMVDTLGDASGGMGGTGGSWMDKLGKYKGTAQNAIKGYQQFQQAGGGGQQEQQPQPLDPWKFQAGQVPNTTLPDLGLITGMGGGGGMDINDPQVKQALLEMLKRQQGGAFA